MPQAYPPQRGSGKRKDVFKGFKDVGALTKDVFHQAENVVSPLKLSIYQSRAASGANRPIMISCLSNHWNLAAFSLLPP